MIPAYIAYRVAKLWFTYRWRTPEHQSYEEERLHGLYEVKPADFSVLDYPNRLLAITYTRLRGIHDRKRFLLNFSGIFLLHFTLLPTIGVILTISFGIISLFFSSIALININDFSNFFEFYNNYTKYSAFMLGLSVKIQMILIIVLTVLAIFSFHSKIFRKSLDPVVRRIRRHQRPRPIETPYGTAKVRPLSVFSSITVLFIMPLGPYVLLALILPEFAEPTRRDPQHLWQTHFVWPAFFVLFSSVIFITWSIPIQFLQVLIVMLVTKIRNRRNSPRASE